MNILLHICCANCACYTLKALQEKGMKVTGLWYNPNIHPYTEHQKRLMAMGYYADRLKLPVIYNEEYGLDEWLEKVNGKHYPAEERCSICYLLRINETAKTAKEKGFDFFSTTLLYSKKQNSRLIKNISEEMSKEHGVAFYFENFDSGWKEGIEISRDMGLYRQQYCGCIFSEKERHSVDTKQEKKD